MTKVAVPSSSSSSPSSWRFNWRTAIVSIAVLACVCIATLKSADLHHTFRLVRAHVQPLVLPRLRDIQIDPYASAAFARQPSNQTRRYDWVIARASIAPDGVLRDMITVNGASPGPTIEANVGDTVVVRVRNRLVKDATHPERQHYSTMMHEVHETHTDSHVALHWHGLSMRGTPHMDGAHGFASCAIAPGNEHTYTFTLHEDDAGTHWWHSHVGMSRSDGLWGALIVHSREERRQLAVHASPDHEYEQEALVTFGDHYHKPGVFQLSWFMSLSSLGFEPTPESGLINGRNAFACGRAMAQDTACSGLHARHSVIELASRQRTRLRLINVGAVGNQFFSIDQHTLTVIEADGRLVKPFTVKRLPVAPGQRYSVIINAPSQDKHDGERDFWLRTFMDHECFNMPNPALNTTSLAVLRYVDRETSNDQDFRRSRRHHSRLHRRHLRRLPPVSQPWPHEPEPENGIFVDACQDVHHSALVPLLDNTPAPRDFDRRIILSARMPKLSRHNLAPMGYINASSWRSDVQQPLLSQYSHPAALPPAGRQDTDPMVIELDANAVVEVVVQNFDDGPHPFHLHGHKFWVMETFMSPYLQGPYRDTGQSATYNTTHAVQRDTINVPRRGYAVVRWRADNAGVWAFHCHVLVHMAAGMAMAFVDAKDEIARLGLPAQQCVPIAS